MLETTENAAGVPLNDTVGSKYTAVAPFKPEPARVTAAPIAPLVGEKPVTCGRTTKLVELAAVHGEQVTLIGPVVAAAGAAAEICVLETTVNVAGAPLKMTAVTPMKLVPMMVTEAPAEPLAGEKEMIPGFTVKLPELVAVPAVLVTLMGPLVAPGGTMALSRVSEMLQNEVAAVP